MARHRLCAFCKVAAGVLLIAIAGESSPAGRAFEVQWGVKIPMRDGVKLNATLYRPAAQNQGLPVIVTITPYVTDRFHDVGAYFATHGYVFAAIDSRGRGNSEGEFIPWMQEAPDGFDAIQWLAQQPFADGQVGMWGGSYGGKNQWAIAGLAPPALKTIVPASAGYVGLDMGLRRNIPFPFMQQWLTLISGRTPNTRLYGDVEYWNGAFFELSRGDIPYRRFDEMTGNPSANWREWMAHPHEDAFWDRAGPASDQYAAIRIPVLSLTGIYDSAQLGTLEFRRKHLQAAPSLAPSEFLVIGPWDHPGTRVPSRLLGGLDFGAVSVLDVKQLHVEWYDWVMKHGTRPSFLSARFVYFVTGSNQWTGAGDLNAATVRTEALFLSSPVTDAGSVASAGALIARAPRQPMDQYRYDPSLPAINEGVEGEGAVSPRFLTDDRSVTRLHGDGLIYETQPLGQGRLVGQPCAILYLSMNVPDTDIRVQLFEVRADGTSVFLTQDFIRARYRRDPRNAVLVNPGEVDRYDFDRFPFVAREIAAGSRIRLAISPLGASIHNQRNRNSGRSVEDETAADNRVADVKVVLGRDRSRVVLPWGDTADSVAR
jgi:uncharacterized protein